MIFIIASYFLMVSNLFSFFLSSGVAIVIVPSLLSKMAASCLQSDCVGNCDVSAHQILKVDILLFLLAIDASLRANLKSDY